MLYGLHALRGRNPPVDERSAYKIWGFATELALVTGGLAQDMIPAFYFSLPPSTHVFSGFPAYHARHLGHVVACVVLEALPGFNSCNSTHSLRIRSDSICG